MLKPGAVSELRVIRILLLEFSEAQYVLAHFECQPPSHYMHTMHQDLKAVFEFE